MLYLYSILIAANSLSFWCTANEAPKPYRDINQKKIPLKEEEIKFFLNTLDEKMREIETERYTKKINEAIQKKEYDSANGYIETLKIINPLGAYYCHRELSHVRTCFKYVKKFKTTSALSPHPTINDLVSDLRKAINENITINTIDNALNIVQQIKNITAQNMAQQKITKKMPGIEKELREIQVGLLPKKAYEESEQAEDEVDGEEECNEFLFKLNLNEKPTIDFVTPRKTVKAQRKKNI